MMHVCSEEFYRVKFSQPQESHDSGNKPAIGLAHTLHFAYLCSVVVRDEFFDSVN